MGNRYRRRTDANHKQIVNQLNDVPRVKTRHTAHFGDGFADFMARVEGDGTLYLFEVKTEDDTHGLTDAEIDFMTFIFGVSCVKYSVIRNAEDALCAMNLV